MGPAGGCTAHACSSQSSARSAPNQTSNKRCHSSLPSKVGSAAAQPGSRSRSSCRIRNEAASDDQRRDAMCSKSVTWLK
eukprot:scaffold47138_cov63-Phaeocystis_antarctica.AAC.2